MPSPPAKPYKEPYRQYSRPPTLPWGPGVAPEFEAARDFAKSLGDDEALRLVAYLHAHWPPEVSRLTWTPSGGARLRNPDYLSRGTAAWQALFSPASHYVKVDGTLRPSSRAVTALRYHDSTWGGSRDVMPHHLMRFAELLVSSDNMEAWKEKIASIVAARAAAALDVALQLATPEASAGSTVRSTRPRV